MIGKAFCRRRGGEDAHTRPMGACEKTKKQPKEERPPGAFSKVRTTTYAGVVAGFPYLLIFPGGMYPII